MKIVPLTVLFLERNFQHQEHNGILNKKDVAFRGEWVTVRIQLSLEEKIAEADSSAPSSASIKLAITKNNDSE